MGSLGGAPGLDEVFVRTDTDRREFHRRNVDAVVRFAARRSRTPEEVVDLVAAVWLEVIASLHRFDVSPDLDVYVVTGLPYSTKEGRADGAPPRIPLG